MNAAVAAIDEAIPKTSFARCAILQLLRTRNCDTV